jgi:N utilization substance protein A
VEKVVDIIYSIAYEKGLKIEKIQEVVKEALVETAKSVINRNYDFDVEMDDKSKSIKLFQKITIVDNEDERLDNVDCYIAIEDAIESDKNLQIGDIIEYEIDLENLGRDAVNILYTKLEMGIQKLLKEDMLEKYQSKQNKIVTGSVVNVDMNGNTSIEIGEVRAILRQKNRIKGEVFKVGDVVKSILKFVKDDNRYGIQLELSRTAPKFLEALITLEVPEVKDGHIKIENIARIPGLRAKVSLSTEDEKADPIGSVVGVGGTRIKAVSAAICNENIDCIEYSDIPELYISRALAPAIIKSVEVKPSNNSEEKPKAIVSIPSDQKSKAIGKAGINIRLASMLTGYDIELNEIDAASKDIENIENTEENNEEKMSLSDFKSLFKN